MTKYIECCNHFQCCLGKQYFVCINMCGGLVLLVRPSLLPLSEGLASETSGGSLCENAHEYNVTAAKCNKLSVVLDAHPWHRFLPEDVV